MRPKPKDSCCFARTGREDRIEEEADDRRLSDWLKARSRLWAKENPPTNCAKRGPDTEDREGGDDPAVVRLSERARRRRPIDAAKRDVAESSRNEQCGDDGGPVEPPDPAHNATSRSGCFRTNRAI